MKPEALNMKPCALISGNQSSLLPHFKGARAAVNVFVQTLNKPGEVILHTSGGVWSKQGRAN